MGWGGGAAESHICTLVIGDGGLNESEHGLLRAACGRRDVPLRAPSGNLTCAGRERPQQDAQQESDEKQVHATRGPAGRCRYGWPSACHLIHAVLRGTDP